MTNHTKRILAARAFACGAAIAFAGYCLGAMTHQPADPPPPASIGANVVPPLTCQEDEVIGFYQHGPTPYHLACIHLDG